jgi:hypothetical protein
MSSFQIGSPNGLNIQQINIDAENPSTIVAYNR